MDSSENSQAAAMMVEPQAEHRWLLRLVGEWTSELNAPGPDGAMLTVQGTETVRAMGDLWIKAEGNSEGAYGPGQTLMLVGFDTDRRRFVGTFASSDMAYLWVYDGSLSEDGRSLLLDSVGPSLEEPGVMDSYRDVTEMVSDDERLLRSLVQRDGQWHEFMLTRYLRKK